MESTIDSGIGLEVMRSVQFVQTGSLLLYGNCKYDPFFFLFNLYCVNMV